MFLNQNSMGVTIDYETINSNKGCFWIVNFGDIILRNIGLTVTKVVFEFC